MTTATPITSTIFEQLGGNKFVAMTGAQVKFYEQDKEIMVLFRGSRKAQMMTITLRPTDLYRVQFFIRTNSKGKQSFCFWDYELVDSYSDVSCDMLQGIFTDVTGLATRL